MQGIRDDDGLEPSLEGIEPDERQADDNGYPKRNIPRIENEFLQDDGYQVEPESRAYDAGDEKDHCTRFITPETQSFFEIGIDRNQMNPVEHGQKDFCDQNESNRVSEYKLEIAETTILDSTRHRNKRNTREGRSNHSKGNQIPFGIPVRDEECRIIRRSS